MNPETTLRIDYFCLSIAASLLFGQILQEFTQQKQKAAASELWQEEFINLSLESFGEIQPTSLHPAQSHRQKRAQQPSCGDWGTYRNIYSQEIGYRQRHRAVLDAKRADHRETLLAQFRWSALCRWWWKNRRIAFTTAGRTDMEF